MFKSNILKYLTNSLMLRRLWFVVAIFFATTLLFVVNRAVFLIYYHDMAADYSFAEIMQMCSPLLESKHYEPQDKELWQQGYEKFLSVYKEI